MALPRIQVEVTADTKQAEAGFQRVEQGMIGVGKTADATNSRIGRFGGGLNRTVRPASAMQGQLRNLGFQLNDFATQVGAGTSASVALGQQLPQLLQGFGGLGIALSVIAAVGIPVATALRSMGDSGRDLTTIFGTLEPIVLQIGEAFRGVAQTAISFAEVVVNNLDRILITAGTVAALMAGRWVAGFVAARLATFTLVGALTALRAALIRTGIGALIIAAGELIFQFSRLVQAAGGFGEALGLIGNVFREVFERMRISVSLMGELFEALGMVIQGAFLTAFGFVQDAFTSMINTIIGGINAVRGVAGADPIALMEGGTAGERGAGMIDAGGAILGSSSGSLGEALTGPFESIQKIRDLLASMKEERITLPDILGTNVEDEAGGGKGKTETEKQLDNQIAAFESLRETGRNTYAALGNFIQQFAGKSKAAAIAAIAIQKGLSIAQIIANTAAAQMRVRRA